MKNIVLTKEDIKQHESILALQGFCSNGILNRSERAQYLSMTKRQKEKLVREIHFRNKRSKDFYHTSDGRIKSKNPQFIAPTLDILIDKLYEYYFGVKLEDIFKEWVRYRAATKIVSPKTIQEDIGLWNISIAGSKIATIKPSEIKPVHIAELFHTWTGQGLITRKDFNNRKSILNSVLGYAVLHEVITTNPLTSTPCNHLKFKSPPKKKKAYTIDERRKLIDYLESLEPDAYILAILLDSYGIFRIGELKNISWNENDGNAVHIEEQLVVERDLQDDFTFSNRHIVQKPPKGNPDYSIRTEYISDKGVEILKKMKSLNPDGEFLFMYNGRPINTDTFNRRLKRYCDSIGIDYLPSHALRFTGASILYDSGAKMTEIQKLLGHSNLKMSMHYLQQHVNPENSSNMADILN